MGIEVRPGDEDALRRYCDPDGQFNYQLFCEEMDSRMGAVFELERKPECAPSLVTQSHHDTLAAAQGGLPELTPDESIRLDSLLETMAAVAQIQGVVWKEIFRDFDKGRHQLITETQFHRALSTALPSLTSAERSLLAKAHRVGGGASAAAQINYALLHERVVEKEAERDRKRSRPMPDSIGRFRRGRDVASARSATSARDDHGREQDAEVMQELLRIARERRIRVKDAFVDYDRFHMGFVSKANFVRALRVLPFDVMGAAALEKVAERYFDEARQQVDYRAFVDDVEEAFGVFRGLNTCPTADPRAVWEQTVRPGETSRDRAKHSLPSGLSSSDLDAVLKEIRRKVYQRGTELVNTFQDFDRTHEEHITPSQFLRALSSMQLLPVEAWKQEALEGAFHGQGSRSHLVHWRAFKDAIEPSEISKPLGEDDSDAGLRDTSRLTRPRGHQRRRPTAETMVGRLQAWVQERGVEISDLFRDADPLRHGAVTRHQLVAGLSSAGFALQTDEADVLAKAYADPAHGRDAEGNVKVDYIRLASDVDAAFVPQDLERHPEADPEAMLSASSRRLRTRDAGDDTGNSRVSSEEMDGLYALMHDLHHRVQAERAELVPFFEELDRMRHGTITTTQFKRVLSMLSRTLPVGKAEADLLGRAFASRESDGSFSVHYRWFTEAVDRPDAVLMDLVNLPRNARLTLAGALAAKRREEAAASSSSSRDHAATALRPRPTSSSSSASSPTPESAMEHLRSVCLLRGVRLRDFFEDHDPLHRGMCSQSRFRSALATAGVSSALSAEELDEIESALRDESFPDKVRWRELAQSVDGVGEDLAHRPTATRQRPKPQPAQGVDPEAQANVDQEQIDALCERLWGTIQARGINLKPAFLDFDRHRHGTVPAPRFRAILADGALQLRPRDLEVLAEAFRAREGRDLVYWREFLARVDPSVVAH